MACDCAVTCRRLAWTAPRARGPSVRAAMPPTATIASDDDDRDGELRPRRVSAMGVNLLGDVVNGESVVGADPASGSRAPMVTAVEARLKHLSRPAGHLDRIVTSPQDAGSGPGSAGASRTASPPVVLCALDPRGLVEPQVRGRVVRRPHRRAGPRRSSCSARCRPGGYRVSIAPWASARYSRLPRHRQLDELRERAAPGSATRTRPRTGSSSAPPPFRCRGRSGVRRSRPTTRTTAA